MTTYSAIDAERFAEQWRFYFHQSPPAVAVRDQSLESLEYEEGVVEDFDDERSLAARFVRRPFYLLTLVRSAEHGCVEEAWVLIDRSLPDLA